MNSSMLTPVRPFKACLVHLKNSTEGETSSSDLLELVVVWVVLMLVFVVDVDREREPVRLDIVLDAETLVADVGKGRARGAVGLADAKRGVETGVEAALPLGPTVLQPAAAGVEVWILQFRINAPVSRYDS